MKVDVSKPKKQQVVKTFRLLSNYMKDNFCSFIVNESHKLNEITLTDDVNAQMDIFNHIFVKCLDVHAPLVTKKIKRPLPPWMNANLSQAIVERNSLQNVHLCGSQRYATNVTFTLLYR